ncbi:MAG: hypothetical protein U9N77_16125, partial [Thermodesulfobacteriota bacterium]|nr:hypothetical protein [Thermodesulfobacteriota bacterium]
MPKLSHGDTLEALNFDARFPDASINNIAFDETRNILFYADGNVVTILNSDNLNERSRLEIEKTITGLALDESTGMLYIACGSGGIAVIETADPDAPIAKAFLKLDPSKNEIHATGMDFFNNRLYIADIYFGMRIIDVSNPLNPNQSGSYEQYSEYTDSKGEKSSYSGGYHNIKVKEIASTKYAFILDKYYGLRIFDVSTDSEPKELDRYDMRTSLYWGQLSEVVDLAVDNKYVYISDSTHGITVLDFFSYVEDETVLKISEPVLSDPNQETPSGQLETVGSASGLFLSGNTLYAADGNNGLFTADISDRSNPRQIKDKTYETTGAYSVYQSGDGEIFMGNCKNGLVRLQWSETAAQYVKKASHASPFRTDALFADEEYAYLLNSSQPHGGLRIISLSDAGEYTLAGSVVTPGSAAALYVYESKAYVADNAAGITIIDINDTSAPVVSDSFDTGGAAVDVLVFRNSDDSLFCAVADKNSGLIITEISNTDVLIQKGVVDIKNAQALALYNKYLPEENKFHPYVCVVNCDGLTIVDVSDPAAPFVSGYAATTGEAVDVDITNNYAVVADRENGVVLIDISDPEEPVLTASFDTDGTAEGVDTDGSYIHTADGPNGVVVLGIKDAEPVELESITFYNTPGYALNLFISAGADDKHTFVADGQGGFVSFKHNDKLSGGIDEKPFTDSPDDTGW